jgi:hypothetical protein
VKAYGSGPKNEGTTHFAQVALNNMEAGYGPEQAAKIHDAVGSAGELAETPKA